MLKLSVLLIVLVGCMQAAVCGAASGDKTDEGYLGVFLEPVPEILAVHLDLDTGLGVIASDVAAESPADKAGLKQYDVILSMDGREIKGQREFAEAVRAAGAGSTAKLDIISKGQKKQVQVVLGSLSEAQGPKKGQTQGPRRLLGEEESFRDLLERRSVVPRVRPAPRFGPAPSTPMIDPELDFERWEILEERIAQLEKQQMEILEKLDKLLEK